MKTKTPVAKQGRRNRTVAKKPRALKINRTSGVSLDELQRFIPKYIAGEAEPEKMATPPKQTSMRVRITTVREDIDRMEVNMEQAPSMVYDELPCQIARDYISDRSKPYMSITVAGRYEREEARKFLVPGRILRVSFEDEGYEQLALQECVAAGVLGSNRKP